MKRIMMMLALAALTVAALALSAVPSFALSGEQQCAQEAQAAGSPTYDYSNDSGTKHCEYTTFDNAGNNPNGNGFTDNTDKHQQGRIDTASTDPAVTDNTCKGNPGGQPQGCKNK